ncbi:MAG: molybdopterin-binding protein [Deltaproteobacteria bacterium]|nr:molybdopterin-binding protein [Deltaproteobacteria bacterium]
MKKINIEDAVGTVLAHDMTRIVRGKFKGVGFKKGHVVKKEDIPELLKIGKRSLYVLNLSKNQLHEDDAALRIASAVSGSRLEWTEPREGKINIISKVDGLFKVEIQNLLKVNKLGSIILATLKNNFPCKKGQIVASTRIIPLVIPAKKIEQLEKLIHQTEPILRVKQFKKMKVGAVVTGSEIYNGLIKDDFDPTIGRKIKDSGCDVVKKIIVSDDIESISNAVLELKDFGCELIVITGGLSVDPDDVTRQGVARAGAEISFYGSPVLPGAMFMYALLGNIPVLGLPACVFYFKQTVFDLILPRVLAGEIIFEEDIAQMGHGGLCMNCKVCHFPVCSFGR